MYPCVTASAVPSSVVSGQASQYFGVDDALEREFQAQFGEIKFRGLAEVEAALPYTAGIIGDAIQASIEASLSAHRAMRSPVQSEQDRCISVLRSFLGRGVDERVLFTQASIDEDIWVLLTGQQDNAATIGARISLFEPNSAARELGQLSWCDPDDPLRRVMISLDCAMPLLEAAMTITHQQVHEFLLKQDYFYYAKPVVSVEDRVSTAHTAGVIEQLTTAAAEPANQALRSGSLLIGPDLAALIAGGTGSDAHDYESVLTRDAKMANADTITAIIYSLARDRIVDSVVEREASLAERYPAAAQREASV
jgi:hypothetical protein